MQSLRSLYKSPYLISYVFCFGLIVFVFGIPWSVYLVSNSVIILSILMLFKFNDDLLKWTWNKTILKDLKLIIKTPLLFFMILLFFTVLISGLWSEETKYWIWFTRMKLPFLLLPVVFYIHGRLSSTQWKLIFYFFIATTLCVSMYVLIFYIGNYSELNLMLLKGKSIVSHISHIRFSMIVAIATIMSLHFSFENQNSKSSLEKWIFVPVLIFFFLFNHLLSVKIGILGMDLGVFIYFTIYYLKAKRYQAWLTANGLILALIVIAFLCFPSLQNKFYYTIWQIEEWQHGKWMYYSDIERWVSLQMGIEMIKHHPILGCGMGDLYQMTKETYLECLNSPESKLPHNQFIYSWAFTGIPSIIALLGMIYYTIFQKSWMSNPLVMSIQIVLLSSFLFEYTLETQIGCCLYVYFTMMCWAYLRGEINPPQTTASSCDN